MAFLRVGIPFPNHGNILPQVEKCLEQLDKCDIDTEIVKVQGSNVPLARNGSINKLKSNLCRQTLDGFEYYLSLDADIVFTIDQLKRLIDYNLDIVSGMYPYKSDRRTAVAGKFNVLGAIDLDMKLSMNKTGLMKIGWVGSGFLLIKKTVLEQMDYPWFRYKLVSWVDDAGDVHQVELSEDATFCLNARKYGFPTYIDCDCKLEHLG